MSGKNRHLKGDINPIIAPVHSFHAVEAGDLMVLSATPGLTGAGSTADNYAIPFDYTTMEAASVEASHQARYYYFLGVAMEDSPSGVTENITIAQSGVFRYPLHESFIGAAVTIGAYVSAVSNSIGAGASAQNVAIGSFATGSVGTTAYLGYIMKTESGASFVDFQLRTAYGPGGLAGSGE